MWICSQNSKRNKSQKEKSENELDLLLHYEIQNFYFFLKEVFISVLGKDWYTGTRAEKRSWRSETSSSDGSRSL